MAVTGHPASVHHVCPTGARLIPVEQPSTRRAMMSAMLDHLSIQVADVDRAAAFYDAVLAPIGGKRIMEFPGVIGYGTGFPSFWIGAEETHGDVRQECHIAFTAPSQEAVVAFRDAAAAQGMEVLHEPRLWPEYHAGYFGAFVRDPDGNNVEAVHHTFEQP
jgi:catechol 2,3-dioxygenase-like lactoylglutathione lyase family enzyme